MKRPEADDDYIRGVTRPARHQRLLAFGLVLALTSGAVACNDEPSEPTAADLLAELEGRSLTPAEVAAREQVGQLLCGLDDAVLLDVWDRLTPTQLEFQDFVFSRQCPERNELYARATGRFATAN